MRNLKVDQGNIYIIHEKKVYIDLGHWFDFVNRIMNIIKFDRIFVPCLYIFAFTTLHKTNIFF